MKIILTIFFILFLFFPQTTFANGAGLPQFFTINEQSAKPNPLQLFGVTASSFLIPQDFAPQNYHVDQPINFSIDTTKLQTVIPEESLQRTKFSWDFGDGSKAEGLNNNHIYKKIGSYILVLTIEVYSSQTSIPTKFIDSFSINIVDDKNHTFPKPRIFINGKNVSNAKNRIYKADLKNEVIFDATHSHASSPIVEYLWNFGDGQTSTKPVVTHLYKGSYFTTVVLRVKDKNGFFTDSFIGLQHEEKPKTENFLQKILNLFH